MRWPRTAGTTGYGRAAAPAARQAFKNCDCLIAVGTRFGEIGTGSYSVEVPESLIHIDLDAEDEEDSDPDSGGEASQEEDANESAPRKLRWGRRRKKAEPPTSDED